MNAATLEKYLEYFDLKRFFANNSPLRLLVILGVMCVLYLAARVICVFFEKRLENYIAGRQTDAKAGDAAKSAMPAIDFALFEKVMRDTRRILNLLIIYWGLSRVVINEAYVEAVRVIFTCVCIWAAIEFFLAFVPFNIDIYLRRRDATLKTSQSRSLMPIIKGVIWAIGLTFLLDNLGFHVSTIIAGLGIVGVAVGLAGQAILADFFSYIVILLDKPFRIGDYVELSDGRAGDVEYMGPKTTRLRNLNDDLIICANSEMTKGVLINQGSIHERIVIEQIGVDYSTPIEKLKNMSALLQEIVDSFSQCSFDRACLLSFGASNLQFQLIYLVSEQRDGIKAFMNTRSQVNIAILERFNKEGISMAFPTEHVYLTDLDEKPATPATEEKSESATEEKKRA